MANKQLDASFWSQHYVEGKTPWDIGSISRPLKEYVDQLQNRDLNILIPGSGYGYEAEYLYKKGFSNTVVTDIVINPLREFQKRCPNFPKDQIVHSDFFDLEGSFDLILEQTFFCALDPELRPEYVLKMKNLLNENGRLAGVLFNFPLTTDGPPFGGNLKMYRDLFSTEFKIKVMEPCYNSIPPRQGHEYFFILSNN